MDVEGTQTSYALHQSIAQSTPQALLMPYINKEYKDINGGRSRWVQTPTHKYHNSSIHCSKSITDVL